MDLRYCLFTISVLCCLMLVSSELEAAKIMKQSDTAPETHVGLKDWMFERLIRQALEAFQRLMKKGDSTRNIPVLDPLYTEKETATYTDSSGIVDFVMEMSKSTTTGLSDFAINKVSASMFSLKADIDLTFKQIAKKGVYNVRTSLFNDVNVFYGDGSLDESVTNLNVILHLELGLSLKNLYVKKVGVDFNLQQGNINLDGLFNNSNLGKTVNKILSDGGTNYINKNRGKIQPHIERVVKDKTAHLIDGMTLPELISFLEALINA